MRDLQGSTRLHYLDGLRGWASVSVMVFHELLSTFGLLHAPVCLALGLLDDGSLAVEVFFVLSAVALSQGFLHTGERRLIGRLAAGRYLRLTIPVAAAALIALIMLFAGWMHHHEAAAVLRDRWLDDLLVVPPAWSSWIRFSLFGALMHYRGAQSYGPFMWTMPIEFGGSLLVFGLLALGGRSRIARISLYFAVLIGMLLASQVATIFVFGLLVSELMASSASRHLQWLGFPLFAFAWGMSALCRQDIPALQDRVVAVAVVLAVAFSPLLQRAMQTGLSQWLGRISFPLYLMHGLVVCGPMSWTIIWLHGAGWSRTAIGMLVLPCGATLSFIAAQLFLPVERVAVQASRWFGGALISTCRGAFRPRLV